VIGNPPYLRVQGLRENFEKESEFFEDKFKSATGRFDIYVLFMEKSFDLIQNSGLISFILPHKFLVGDFGIGIRKFFIEHLAVKSILHFGSEMVFDDASTYTCIISLSHNNSSIYYKHLNPIEILTPFNFEKLDYKKLSESSWSLKNKHIEDVFIKLKLMPLTVKDVFDNISQGIVSVGDNIFLMKGIIKGDKFFGYSEKVNSNIEIEAEIMKPLLKGEDVKKYCSLENTYFCFYPHHEVDGKTIPFDEEYFKNKYPLAYNYILPFKDQLINKKIKYKTNPTAWYSLHRSREISLFEQMKIITPEISLGTNMTLDSKNFYHNTKCYTISRKSSNIDDYKFWLGILNSKILWFYLCKTGYVLRGGFFTFKTKYLEPFPLPEICESKKYLLINLVDRALENSKKLNTLKKKLHDYILSQISEIQTSKKLQNWEELEFNEFIKEINKVIKKSEGKKLSKSDEMEWMELFNTKKSEVQSLKSEIDRIDKEIDQMVYELYGLTEEEIKIVEENS